jgi:hypothetical protein
VPHKERAVELLDEATEALPDHRSVLLRRLHHVQVRHGWGCGCGGAGGRFADGNVSRHRQRVDLEREDVFRWFEQGTDGARITALGLMIGNGALRDFAAAHAAITGPRSGNEQYWGLRLAQDMVPDLVSIDDDKFPSGTIAGRGQTTGQSAFSGTDASHDPDYGDELRIRHVSGVW